MAEHPIEGLMKTAMESIKDMVDVNTIVGDAIQAPDGTVIIPISKVTFGFAAGGGDYSNACGCKTGDEEDDNQKSGKDSAKYPFAGGSGAGVSINPIAFMVVGGEHMRLIPVNINSSVDRILDLLPEILLKANDTVKKKIVIKKEIKKDECGEKAERTTEKTEKSSEKE